MATLNTKVLGIDFENPFILASAPPTAKIESIDKAFTLGWGGAVLKTITSIGAMKQGLLNYLESKGFNSPADLKNRAIPNLLSHESLNKTKQVYPQIDDGLCIKCSKCVTICDEHEHSALSLVDGHIKVNQDSCVGCSLCSHVCPKSAIEMKS